VKEAARFNSARSTVAVCDENHLRGVQMVLAFDEVTYSVGIDIHSGEQ
jgi:hypothetical protein